MFLIFNMDTLSSNFFGGEYVCHIAMAPRFHESNTLFYTTNQIYTTTNALTMNSICSEIHTITTSIQHNNKILIPYHALWSNTFKLDAISTWDLIGPNQWGNDTCQIIYVKNSLHQPKEYWGTIIGNSHFCSRRLKRIMYIVSWFRDSTVLLIGDVQR